MNNIEIDARDAIAKLKHLQSQLTQREVANATRMAMNDATRWGKTRVKDAIRTQYNIKSSRITDGDPKKGLSISPATNGNLAAHIKAGHTPISFTSFTGTTIKSVEVGREVFFASNIKTRKSVAIKGKAIKKNFVSVELMKGNRKTLQTAFGLKVSTGVQGASATGGKPVIFARGRYGKPGFQFGKARKPMSALSSISVATAAANTNAIKQYEPQVSQRFQEQLVRQLNRMIDKGTR